MKIDGTGSESAAAWEGDFSFTTSSDEGAHEADGSPHFADEFVGGFVGDVFGGDFPSVRSYFINASAEMLEDFCHEADIA